MGILRTILGSLTVSATALATAAFGADDPTRVFAGCAGRLSAAMEHRWLMGEPADAVMRHRADVLDVLDALPVVDAAARLSHRLDAKAAHRRLLHRATFNDDPADAAWAARRAASNLAACTALLPR